MVYNLWDYIIRQSLIEYLEQKEEPDATLEIPADEESMRNIRAADQGWEAAKMQEFTSWKKV